MNKIRDEVAPKPPDLGPSPNQANGSSCSDKLTVAGPSSIVKDNKIPPASDNIEQVTPVTGSLSNSDTDNLNSNPDPSSVSAAPWQHVSYSKILKAAPPRANPLNSAEQGKKPPHKKYATPYELVPNPDKGRFSTPPIFVLNNECPLAISNIEICQASIRAVGVNCISVCQKFGQECPRYTKSKNPQVSH